MSALIRDFPQLISILLHTPLPPGASPPDPEDHKEGDTDTATQENIQPVPSLLPELADHPYLFQAAFENAVISKCLLKPDGQIYACNAAMSHYLGYLPAEMSHETLFTITSPENAEQITEDLERLAEDSLDSFQIEQGFLHKDGRSLAAMVYVTALYDASHQYLGAVAEIQDLTSQKNEEAVFQAEHLRLKTAEELARMGTFEIDLNTGRTTWSEEIFQMMGVFPESFDINFEMGMLNIHSEDRKSVSLAIQQAIAQREEFRIEFRLMHRDGVYRHHLCHGRVQVDAHDKPVKVVGYLLDVMPFKQRELQLQETNRLLEIQNQQLLRLANLVSDELTGPLAGIQAVASQQADQGHTHDVLPLLAETRHGLDSLEASSTQIRKTRRLEQERKQVSLQTVCERVLQMLEAEIEQARISISLDFSAWSDLEYIPGFLENICFNLMSYAIECCNKQSLTKISVCSASDSDGHQTLTVTLAGAVSSLESDSKHQKLQLVKSQLAASNSRMQILPDTQGIAIRIWF